MMIFIRSVLLLVLLSINSSNAVTDTTVTNNIDQAILSQRQLRGKPKKNNNGKAKKNNGSAPVPAPTSFLDLLNVPSPTSTMHIAHLPAPTTDT